MHPLIYCIPLSLPVIGILGLSAGGVWVWSLPVLIFVLIPVVELRLGGADQTRSSVPQPSTLAHRAVVWSALPAVFAMLAYMFYRVGTGGLAGFELAGGVFTTGLVLGGLGINVAHELGHGRTRTERTGSKAMLAMCLYMHFFIEHNRGHHRHVATDADPASARRGELVFMFWFRSIIGGWRSAWRIDSAQMALFQLIQIGLVVFVAATFGWQVAVAWAFAALFGVLLLETVNYVEHYGLQRAKRPDGRYERVRDVHSWNADHPVGRALLFELTRHADHHANPGRPYATLRHLGQAPQLPTGYPGMIMAALVPPLFFRLMGARLDALVSQQAA